MKTESFVALQDRKFDCGIYFAAVQRFHAGVYRSQALFC